MCSIKLTNDAVWVLRDLYKKWHGAKYTIVQRIPNTSNPVLYGVTPSQKDFFGSLNVEVMHLRQVLCMNEEVYNELKFKTFSVVCKINLRESRLSVLVRRLVRAFRQK